MRAATKFTLILFFTLINLLPASAQKNKDKNKDRIEYRAEGVIKRAVVNGEEAFKLIDSVRFRQTPTLIFSDSAYLFQAANRVEAYGSVRITDMENPETIITSKKLIYEGNKKIAKLRENVVYQEGQQFMYTEKLDYFRETRQAFFYEHGKLVDTVNVLTSTNGRFDADLNQALFSGDVVLTSPKYTLETQSLIYHTDTKIATTTGYTKVTMKDGEVIISEIGGDYNTVSEETTLNKGTVESESYILKGDIINSDQIRDIHTVVGNVELVSKENELIIYGDHAKSWNADGITKIFGHTLMKRAFENDTLYMTADTLISYDSEDETRKKVIAKGKVKIFKPDLQGLADSLVYKMSDSTLTFFKDPILWSGKSQLVSDTIKALIVKSELDKMLLNSKAFVISEDTLGNYNQIKGRNMTIFFKKQELKQVNVNGNGESIYFALNESNELIGMNKLLCSDMTIRFQNRQVKNISFYTKPDAKFMPPHETSEPDKKLKDFNWREEERPELKELLDVRNRSSKKTQNSKEDLTKKSTDR